MRHPRSSATRRSLASGFTATGVPSLPGREYSLKLEQQKKADKIAKAEKQAEQAAINKATKARVQAQIAADVSQRARAKPSVPPERISWSFISWSCPRH